MPSHSVFFNVAVLYCSVNPTVCLAALWVIQIYVFFLCFFLMYRTLV